jgi:hypothetical protein
VQQNARRFAHTKPGFVVHATFGRVAPPFLRRQEMMLTTHLLSCGRPCQKRGRLQVHFHKAKETKVTMDDIPKTEYEQRLGVKCCLRGIESKMRMLPQKTGEQSITQMALLLNMALMAMGRESPLVLYDMDAEQGRITGSGFMRMKSPPHMERHKVFVAYEPHGTVVITPIDLLLHNGPSEESELFIRSEACQQFYVVTPATGIYTVDPAYRQRALSDAREIETA